MSRASLLTALAVAAAGLAGCISLLPKQTPAQLYRFDADTRSAAPPAVADDAARVPVIAPPVSVARAAAGDQLLTSTGREIAFVKGARWISPAAVLWDEAVRRAFAARATRVRLLSRNEVGGGRAFLRLDVLEFEARYPAPEAAPSVRVTLHAMYTHRNGAFASEHTFTADAPAAENRVGPIVAAYGAGVDQAVAQAVAWADAHADEAAAEPPPGADPPPAPRPPVRSTTSTSTQSTSTRTGPGRP